MKALKNIATPAAQPAESTPATDAPGFEPASPTGMFASAARPTTSDQLRSAALSQIGASRSKLDEALFTLAQAKRQVGAFDAAFMRRVDQRTYDDATARLEAARESARQAQMLHDNMVANWAPWAG